MAFTLQNKPCDRPSCDFRADPDDPYRYVCLPCGLERSTKKSDPPKPSGVDQALIWTILIMIGWLSLLLIDVDQPINQPSPSVQPATEPSVALIRSNSK